ncbi:MAG: chromosomal replication initiator protein DnaA [Phycisphaeraceae bacterium]
MPKLDPALWRDMMGYLRRKHAPICRQWFEELRPVSLDSGLLQIYTSNAVQRNYLQRKCLEQFNEAAQEATGALVAVRFVNTQEHGGNGTTTLGRGGVPAPGHLGGTPAAGNLASAHGASANSDASESARSHEPLPDHHGDVQFEQIVISPDYIFDTFVPGPGNELAYAAAQAVASQPGIAYNPLFIHGGVGLGKTHLLQAICQTIMHAKPNARICYLSCDAFTNQFLDCVQKGMMDQFRHRYRHVDVLVVDDIHFLANRERTQEEFFHTFNELHQSRKQIVISSDAPPSEIPQLEQRLVSRFQWGLVANITKPDYETRVAIVRAKSKLRGLDLPDDVFAYIATKIDSNARELEGALTTIQGHAMLNNKPIDLAMAQKALGEPSFGSRNSQVTLQNIIDVVTAYYNVKLSDLQSKRRHKSITMPRQVCMWLARKRTRFSLQEIGGHFGGRDHTTVMHSIETVEIRCGNDPVFADQIRQLDERIAR